MSKNIKRLLELDKEIILLRQISSLLSWDEVVLMPEKSVKERGEQISLIHVLLHDRLANKIPKFLSAKPGNPAEKKIIERYKWLSDRAVKIPKSHVEELAKVLSESHHAWEKARKAKDFKIFLPHLKKVVELKRKEAQYMMSRTAGKRTENTVLDHAQKSMISDMPKIKIHPYEVLLQDFERGMTIADLDKTFSELRNGLIKIIKKGKRNSLKNISMPEDIQKEIVQDISTMILQDNGRFLISRSVHPFMTTISGNDFRITTAIRNDPFFSITSTAHESGHALYESQFNPKYLGTILGDAPSMGIHESQSRIWENQILRSMEFWKYYSKKLGSMYPELKKYSVKDYYDSLNHFKPSLIRIESDELTYCLHVIIRYELEKKLIEGSLEVKDLPKAWNTKYKEYLGVTPKNDTEGVMQDTHWADGLFGYFPTYALGSIYSAMIYDAMNKKVNIKKDVLSENFDRIREWLRVNIHQYGQFYSTREIIRKACGSEIDIKPFLKYLEEKYN